MPFEIKANSRDNQWTVRAPMAGLTLLQFLQQNQVPIRSSCMGKGLCHQCRVKVQKGLAPVADMDRKTFSEENLKAGWRLSCGLRPKTNIEVFFPQVYQFTQDLKVHRKPQGQWWVACDLGTTGVELSAQDSQGEWANIKALNRQISMGADVMTRLEYAQKNGVEPLNKRITSQLGRLSKELTKAAEGEGEFSQKIFVAGNSAVNAFLANQDIEQLAVSPYQPVSFEAQKIFIQALEVETVPLIHSFVGGDLFAGLFYLWKQKQMADMPWILVDVGTNSEIIFWDTETLFVSSTPAGPAFEGSSISIGMRAEAGAVIEPKFSNDQWNFKTIDDDAPIGICGSALVEMVDESVKANIVKVDGEVINEQGLMLNSELGLNQDDIREFQLAKSAIRTGLELVASESQHQPQKLFLAGAFGSHLNLEACFDLGLFPKLEVETLGNTSLKGTVLWGNASSEERQQFQHWLNQNKKPIELALSDEFQQAFVEHMRLAP